MLNWISDFLSLYFSRPHMPLPLVSKPGKTSTCLAWRHRSLLWNRKCTAEHPLRPLHHCDLRAWLQNRYVCGKLDLNKSKNKLVLAAHRLIYSGLQAGFMPSAKLSTAVVRLQMLQQAALKPVNASSSSSAALRQPSYSNSHLTPPRFDKYFTTERGHCPGAPGSTLKECANEMTAQIAQQGEDEDPLTQLHPGKV